MGWASGGELAENLWDAVRPFVNEEDRETLAKYFIEAFEAEDCDTIYECEHLVRDAKMEDTYWPEEEE